MTEILEVSFATVPASKKEGNCLDDIEPTACSALSEKGSTSMKNLLEPMAMICCIYKVEFKNLVEDEVDDGKDTERKVDFVWSYLPYNVQTNRSADNSEYSLFISEDMNAMSKILGDVTRLGSHTHKICSPLQFAFW